MAENETAAEQVEGTQEQQAEQKVDEPQGSEIDWKAEARKWEGLAKKGKAAEEELEALKQAQMTEQEKANARAEKAEAELAELKAEAERIEAAHQTAAKTGVPYELLEFCKDADAMGRFARVYAGLQPQQAHAAGRARASAVVAGGEGKVASGDLFAQAAERFLK